MTQHTPGPWKVRKQGHGTFIGFASDSFIGEVYTASGRQEANANLLAAAPELLAALKEIKHWADITRGDPNNNLGAEIESVFNVAYAAIAKAEGKNS
jgi:hypothetical protein